MHASSLAPCGVFNSVQPSSPAAGQKCLCRSAVGLARGADNPRIRGRAWIFCALERRGCGLRGHWSRAAPVERLRRSVPLPTAAASYL